MNLVTINSLPSWRACELSLTLCLVAMLERMNSLPSSRTNKMDYWNKLFWQKENQLIELDHPVGLKRSANVNSVGVNVSILVNLFHIPGEQPLANHKTVEDELFRKSAKEQLFGLSKEVKSTSLLRLGHHQTFPESVPGQLARGSVIRASNSGTDAKTAKRARLNHSEEYTRRHSSFPETFQWMLWWECLSLKYGREVMCSDFSWFPLYNIFWHGNRYARVCTQLWHVLALSNSI